MSKKDSHNYKDGAGNWVPRAVFNTREGANEAALNIFKLTDRVYSVLLCWCGYFHIRRPTTQRGYLMVKSKLLDKIQEQEGCSKEGGMI